MKPATIMAIVSVMLVTVVLYIVVSPFVDLPLTVHPSKCTFIPKWHGTPSLAGAGVSTGELVELMSRTVVIHDVLSVTEVQRC